MFFRQRPILLKSVVGKTSLWVFEAIQKISIISKPGRLLLLTCKWGFREMSIQWVHTDQSFSPHAPSSLDGSQLQAGSHTTGFALCCVWCNMPCLPAYGPGPNQPSQQGLSPYTECLTDSATEVLGWNSFASKAALYSQTGKLCVKYFGEAFL